ncbi:hypothetical protein VTG60DRAFT_2686 [Thermothelomyces hinnuleus]
MSRYEDIELSISSHEIGLVSSKVLATHTFANAPALDILLVPGGAGTRMLEERGDRAMQDFIAARYPELRYLLTVCTGSATAAAAGVLDGRRATSNKGAWSWVVTHGRNVTWVPSARWVVDGNIWTSSGVAAGMDMVYAFLEHYYADNRAPVQTMINLVEYAPHTDPHWDPFSIVHNVPGADKNGSLVDCVKPVGF